MVRLLALPTIVIPRFLVRVYTLWQGQLRCGDENPYPPGRTEYFGLETDQRAWPAVASFPATPASWRAPSSSQ